jgi:hypothetical protein
VTSIDHLNTSVEDVCKRSAVELKMYEESLGLRQATELGPDAFDKPRRSVNSGVDFDRQKTRLPFIRDCDPPHPDRFNFDNHYPSILSTAKSPKTVVFDKM